MKIIKLVSAIAGATILALLTGCVTTYPYQSAFDSCDSEAGACYRYCEDVADSDYELGACHNDCDSDANRCFASAYDGYSYGGSAYSGSYYQPAWPWRGRYGGWGPTNGYYFDFSYYGGSTGYDRPRRGRGYSQGGQRDPRRDGRSGRPHDGRSDNNNGPYDGRRGERGRDQRGAGAGTGAGANTGNNNAQPPRRGTPPPSAPVQQSAPPPASTPQSAPPPASTNRPTRPAKPAKERSGSGNTQPEDY